MSAESNITTLLTLDDPRVLTAAYALDRADRQLLDAQILGVQRHLADGLIRGQVRSWFRLAATSAAVQVGDILCAAPFTASESNPALADRRVTIATEEAIVEAGACLVIATNFCPPGGFINGVMLGLVGPGLTGLALGDAGPVRLVAGRCQKVAAFVEGDYPVGFVDGFGNLTLGFGAAVGGGAGGGPAGAVPLSNLLYVDGGTAVAEPDRDGSLSAPFAALQDAAAALIAQMSTTAHVLLVTPGDYSGADTFNWDFGDGDLVIRGMTGVDPFMVQKLGSPSPKAGLQLPSVYCSTSEGIARNLGLDSVHCGYVGVALGSLHARASVLPYLEINGEVFLTACAAISITTASTSVTLTDSTFSGTPTVTFTSESAGELRLDSRSHYEFLAAGGTVTNGSIVLLAVGAYQPEGIVTSGSSAYYIFSEADAGKYYRLTHAAPEFWVPSNYGGGGPDTVPIGTRIRGIGTAGQVTIVPSGKTVHPPTGFQLVTRAAFSPFELFKVGATEWELSGDLLPV